MKTLINSQKRQETQQHYYYNEKINTIAIYLIYQCRKESAELSLCSKKIESIASTPLILKTFITFMYLKSKVDYPLIN